MAFTSSQPTHSLRAHVSAAAGGYTTGRAEVVGLLRQRSRPYLFSNTLAPAVAAASITVFDLLSSSSDLRDRLAANTAYFRSQMAAAGFNIRPGSHPIVPIMLGDAALATRMAAAMLQRGVYVVGFSFPVVPKGAARIRVQLSAGACGGLVCAWSTGRFCSCWLGGWTAAGAQALIPVDPGITPLLAHDGPLCRRVHSLTLFHHCHCWSCSTRA